MTGSPTDNIFAAGFEGGETRILDVESASVINNFQQFNEPVVKMAYSPSGELLVTVCKNGSIALHNARRGHLPIKIMGLEFPPEYLHVSFSNTIIKHKMVMNNGRPRSLMGGDDMNMEFDVNSQE